MRKSSLAAVTGVCSPKTLSPLSRTVSRKARFGGLLSLLAVHAGRRAGEELHGGAKIWNGAKQYDTAPARLEDVRSVVRVRPSIIVGLWPPNPTSKSIIAPPRFV